MTRIGRRLIEDFLLPALNDQRYGELLKWVDRDKRHFSIRWSHKNAAKWTLSDTAVFQDWDKLKGHYRPEIKGYYMQAKQRFRAALYKLSSVKKLPCEDKHVKKYQLNVDQDKRNLLPRPRIKKEENQRSIPTSVIRKNTSYIEKPKTVYMEEEEEDDSSLPPSPATPPSPSSSDRSSSSDDQEEMQALLFEYTMAQKKKQMLNNGYSSDDNSPSGVLRENGVGQRIPPHVPTQQVPVYSGSVKQFYDANQKRYESPRVLLVKTFNDLSDEEPHVKEEPIEYEMQSTVDNPSDIALNLSVKSDDSETLSR